MYCRISDHCFLFLFSFRLAKVIATIEFVAKKVAIIEESKSSDPSIFALNITAKKRKAAEKSKSSDQSILASNIATKKRKAASLECNTCGLKVVRKCTRNSSRNQHLSSNDTCQCWNWGISQNYKNSVITFLISKCTLWSQMIYCNHILDL